MLAVDISIICCICKQSDVTAKLFGDAVIISNCPSHLPQASAARRSSDDSRHSSICVLPPGECESGCQTPLRRSAVPE
jgi:hypothetical protein